MSRPSDRFQAETYVNDEPVGAGLASEVADDPHAYGLWIPERLFSRIQLVAQAYELHLLPVLDPNGRNELTRLQAQEIVDELKFIRTVVNDDLLAHYVDQLSELAERCARSPRDEQLLIEGP